MVSILPVKFEIEEAASGRFNIIVTMSNGETACWVFGCTLRGAKTRKTQFEKRFFI